jgi:hypothetical protein
MLTRPIPHDYARPFWLQGPVGNNAFAYERRGADPVLWVPSRLAGTLADVRPGRYVAFEDVDEHDRMQSCPGLAHLVTTTWGPIPTVVVDNHNHVFYFWMEALQLGVLAPGATLVHIDQHKDTREPATGFDGTTLAEAFAYTNFLLNVGNYIIPAQRCGLVGETQLVTSSDGLGDLRLASHRNKILNIDLDFFAPEMSYIEFDRVRRFIDAHLAATALVTFATSPFFIDQERAIEFLTRLVVP